MFLPLLVLSPTTFRTVNVGTVWMHGGLLVTTPTTAKSLTMHKRFACAHVYREIASYLAMTSEYKIYSAVVGVVTNNL
jgi:hypothetical protein